VLEEREKVMGRLRAGLVSGFWAFMLFMAVFGGVVNVSLVKGDSGTIYIRADGSIDPSTAPIYTVDNVTYTFTGNINDSIVIERDNIVVDGAGYTVEGTGAYEARGLYLSGRSNVTIRNMKIKAFYDGIFLYESSNNNLFGNNITNNEHGIFLSSSSNNIISGNNMTNNTIDGVTIHWFSIDNTISRNKMLGNTHSGVQLSWSSHNTVSANIITKNTYGVVVSTNAADNEIYHNNFINNSYQVYFYIAGYQANLWDNAYPSGGNYWSDYTGSDNKNGPSQDQSGSDCIGDTPYIINTDNLDHYPLMIPWPSGPGLHELEASLKAPTRLPPGNSTLLEATVGNNGFSNETDVSLFLFVNNTIVNSTTIPLLEVGSSYAIDYSWTAVNEGYANVTAYVAPVTGELYVVNNQETKIVLLSSKLPVQNINTGLYYETIEEAIDAPETIDGHMIEANVGIYYEHLTISKSLKIVGKDKNITAIDGNKTGSFVVQITANNVVLIGFTIQNSNTDPTPAIRIDSSNNVISNNRIINNGWGIYAFNVYNNTIENNIITNSVYGIYLEYADANTVKNNTISNHQEAGIYIRESINNIFTKNTVQQNKDAVVLVGDYYYPRIHNNKFYHNNFINNTSPGFAQNADDNTWDDGYPSGGNYWSDYTGIDMKTGPNQDQLGSDAIGDTPYTFSGANRDRYPLMNPMGSPQPPIAIFTYAPEQPFKDGVVTFDASTSGDRDGSITSYIWNFGDGNTTTATDPTITHIYTAQRAYIANLTVTDNDGLSHSITKLVTVIEDLLAPTTLHDYDDLWHTADFTITLTATDDLSGVAETYYRINEGPIQNVTANGQPLITTESANNKLEYWSVDNAGNEELPHTTLTEIKLDKTYPNVKTPSRTPDGDVLPGQSVKISVNITDAASQVKNVTLYYAINGGETWTDLPMNHAASNLYEATIPPQEAGTSVRFRIVAYDHAGNNRTLNGAEPYCVYQVVPEFPPSLIMPLFMILTLLAVIFYRREHQTLQNHIQSPFLSHSPKRK